MSDERISDMGALSVPPSATIMVPVIQDGTPVNYKIPVTTLLSGAPGDSFTIAPGAGVGTAGGSLNINLGSVTSGNFAGGDLIVNFGTGNGGGRNGLLKLVGIGTVDPNVPNAIWDNGGYLVFSNGGTAINAPLQSFETITATGSIQSNAATITAQEVVANSVASGAGVRLMLNPPVGFQQRVLDRGANTLTVYPASGAQIESAGTNVGVPIVVGGDATFIAESGSQWVAA